MASSYWKARVRAFNAALAVAGLVWSAAADAHPVERWAREIAEASARFAVPAEWIRRVMCAESGGETMRNGRPIVSSAGAMGLMQLMPSTWRELRSLLGLGPNPDDPNDNILAGTFYLRILYERFGYPGLFAAYNAGPGRYAGVLSGTRRLPAQTRTYVAAVMRGTGPSGASDAVVPKARSPILFALVRGSASILPNASRAPVSGARLLFVELGGGRE